MNFYGAESQKLLLWVGMIYLPVFGLGEISLTLPPIPFQMHPKLDAQMPTPAR